MVFLDFEEGVLFEHLLDFLVQLERRQLQQADRLLQLRRQRQMLRQANLQGRFHDDPPCVEYHARPPKGVRAGLGAARRSARGAAVKEVAVFMATYMQKCSPR